MVQPIDKLLSWRDLIFMTMAFTFILAPLGMPPIVAVGVAVLSFALWQMNKKVADPKNVTERKVAFLFSLFVGCAFGLISLQFLIPDASYIGTFLFPVCLAFFINYGTVLGWWKLTAGLFTLLLSVVPAIVIGSYPGFNMLISVIISSCVYALFGLDKNIKKEPWMVSLSAIIGMMIGSFAAFMVPGSHGNMDLLENLIEFASSGGQFSSLISEKVIESFDFPMAIMWVIYLVIGILTFIPGALPYGWDTLFKVK